MTRVFLGMGYTVISPLLNELCFQVRFIIIPTMPVRRNLPSKTEIMNAVVVSDLHIGLPFFRKAAFIQLVESLDSDTALILNGDIIDNPYQRLGAEDEKMLSFLRDQSFQRRVVWIYGNHDENFRMSDPGRIEFQRGLTLGDRLMIVHGDDFDTVMPKSRWFIRLFKFCHNVRLRMGAAPIHVAELAKRWTPLLYKVLTVQVKKNAVDCALQAGVEAIACGHTHFAEDTTSRGVRYINTGTWTENPAHYLSINATEILLRSCKDSEYAATRDGYRDELDLKAAGDELIGTRQHGVKM